MIVIVLVFALTLDWVFGECHVSAPLHLVPHLIAILAALRVDMSRERAIVTPLAAMSLAYAVIVLIPIGFFAPTPRETLQAPTFNDLAVGSWYHLLFFSVFCLTYLFIRNRKSWGGGAKRLATTNSVSVDFRWIFALSAGTWTMNMLLIVFIGHVNLLLYALNPQAFFEQVRYSGINAAQSLREACYLLFCAAFAVELGRRPSRKLIAACVFYIAVYSITSGYKHNWFEPLVAILVVRGFISRRSLRGPLALSIIVAVIGIPLAFSWRDHVHTDVAKTLLNYDEPFYFGSRAMVELSPKLEYFEKGVEDLLITPIPRAIWPSKPELYGLTNEVLMPALYGDDELSVVRSFPTMGLAEAWIALGALGIILSGLLIGALFAASATAMTQARSPGRVLWGIAVCASCYDILRVGIFATFDYNLLFLYLLAIWGIDRYFQRKVLVPRRALNNFLMNSQRNESGAWRTSSAPSNNRADTLRP